jgi:chromosome partitioning protein
MTRIIAIVNQKGGVGKTTTAVNLATALALLGRKVLLVDIDPQGNASSGLGFDQQKITPSVYHLLLGQKKIQEVVLETPVRNLNLIGANIDLIGVEVELIHQREKEKILKKVLGEIKNKYHYIIIDCPPSLGMLTINSLCAATGVIIPVQCEYYALEGISQLLKTINLIQANLNPALIIEGLLLTMYDTRTNLSTQVAEEIREYFGGQVYQTYIPRNVRISESPSFGQPVIIYDRKSSGAQAYLSFTREVIKNE